MRNVSLVCFVLCLFNCLIIHAQQDCEDGMVSEVYNITLCPGESYLGYDSSGVYYDTIAISPYCDLIRTYFISVNSFAPKTIVGIGNNFCNEINQDSLFLIAPFDAGAGCDYIPEINFPNFDGILLIDTICYAQSDMSLEPGFYFDLDTTNPNCDSSTLVIVVPVPENTSSSYSICELEDFQMPLIDTTGQEISAVGFYTIARATAAGCSYLEEVEITSAVIPADITLDTTICAGAYLYGLTETGTYTVKRKDINGCSYDIFVDLTVRPPVPDVRTNVSICESDFEGMIPEPIEKIDSNGCPYLEILDLTILMESNSMITAEICEGEEFNGYTVAGTYTDILTAANGCDSIITTELTVIPLADCDTAVKDTELTNEFFLTPNPSHGTIRLNSASPINNSAYKIVDMLGKTVMSDNHLPANNTVDISSLANGTYLFSLKRAGARDQAKMIVKL